MVNGREFKSEADERNTEVRRFGIRVEIFSWGMVALMGVLIYKLFC